MNCLNKEEIKTKTDQKLRQFVVTGLRASNAFQKSCCCVEKLWKSFPKKYAQPKIQPMFDLEWDEYLITIRREIGGNTWKLTKPVAIFLDDEFLGSDDALFRDVDDRLAEETGGRDVYEYISDKINNGRKFAYISVAVDHKVIGAMLFELYNDFLPITCANFLERCELDYKKTPIHRIVKNGWIQFGGWSLEERWMPCENYIIPHDRRGVLSMCNRKRHRNNTTQFFVTLAPTPWMNFRYVAFGQLIQGVELLKFLENQKTNSQSPNNVIEIYDCGEYTPFKQELCILKDFSDIDSKLDDYSDDPSIMKESKYKEGKYCLMSDMKSYFPFQHLPNYMFSNYLFDKPKKHIFATSSPNEICETEMTDRANEKSQKSSNSDRSDKSPNWTDFDSFI